MFKSLYNFKIWMIPTLQFKKINWIKNQKVQKNFYQKKSTYKTFSIKVNNFHNHCIEKMHIEKLHFLKGDNEQTKIMKYKEDQIIVATNVMK